MLLLPRIQTAPINAYFDESYLDGDHGGRAGTIQTAIVMHARTEAELRRWRSTLGKNVMELKGSKINVRNRRVYQRFVNAIAQIIRETGERCPVRSVVGVNSAHRRSRIDRIAEESLTNDFSGRGLSIDSIPQIARLIDWLSWHLRFVFPSGCGNPTTLVIDDSYDTGRKLCRSEFAVIHQLGIALPAQLRTSLPGILRSFLSFARTEMGLNCPPVNIADVQFVNSRTSIGIQAADVISNLFRAWLCYHKGVRTDACLIKYELLGELIEDSTIDSEWLDWLELIRPCDAAPKFRSLKPFVARVALGA